MSRDKQPILTAGKPEQMTKFYRYHAGLMAKYPTIALEEDCRTLATQGWRLVYVANVGGTALSSCIVATYQK